MTQFMMTMLQNTEKCLEPHSGLVTVGLGRFIFGIRSTNASQVGVGLPKRLELHIGDGDAP